MRAICNHMYIYEREGEIFTLEYIRKMHHASNCIHLRDAINNEGTLASNNIGELCAILPSSTCYMHECTQETFI